MAGQRTSIILFSLVICFIGFSCAETTRYRVLRFFFDGVPNPAEVRALKEAAEKPPSAADTPPVEAEKKQTVANHQVSEPAIRPHPPYGDFRCGVCHSGNGMSIGQTPQEGLCRQCHGDIPGDARYAHGPVAVSDCLFCHHHHGGQFPKMLRTTVQETCFQCHDQDDLIEGDHHRDLDDQSCTKCHLPHGGDNRFFVKEVTP